MSGEVGDARKRLAEAATPPAQNVETLADLVRRAVLSATPHVGPCAYPDEACDCRAMEIRLAATTEVENALVLAGYLPPAEVARLVQEARARAVEEAVAAIQRRGDASPSHYAEYWAGEFIAAYRPVPGERSEAGA